MEAFQRVKHVEKTQSEKQKDNRKKQWTPPPPPFNRSFKVNVNAAIDVKAKVVGLGVVIRDDEGKIVVAATKPSRLICGVSIA